MEIIYRSYTLCILRLLFPGFSPLVTVIPEVSAFAGTGKERNSNRLASSPLAGRWLPTTIELIVVFYFPDFPLLSPFLYLKCLRLLWYRKREKLEKIGQQPSRWPLAQSNDGANCRLLFPRNSLLSPLYLKCLRLLWYRKREKLEKIGQQPTGWTLAHRKLRHTVLKPRKKNLIPHPPHKIENKS